MTPRCPRALTRTHRRHIARVSRTAYGPATPGCLDLGHDLQGTRTNGRLPHPVRGRLHLTVPSRKGITIYGCGQDEAALFRALAPRFGVLPIITEAAVSDVNIELAAGNRSISIGHRAQVTNSALLALSQVGVEYISTRSIGYNHLDVDYARRIGITVENVVYSPDSVADYTLMLMLMAVRHAKSTIRRVDTHDYRLGDVRGRELRDLTVGVVGTGRIGRAVMDRLRGFGCRILAHDSQPVAAADYVPLDDLLQSSDIVTLHTPLTPDTHHLLDAERIARMKPGAVVVNTGRGSLLHTEALLSRWRRRAGRRGTGRRRR